MPLPSRQGMDYMISLCPIQPSFLWFLCSNSVSLASFSVLHPQAKQCQMLIWEVPVHLCTEGMVQQRLKNLSALGWEKKHQIRDRWRKVRIMRITQRLHMQQMYFTSFCPMITVAKHEWENSTHCWCCYEWVAVLGVLQRTDFCFGETKRLCKAAAVKAIIRMALVLAVKSRAWSRVSWSRPHQAPPAASPVQTQQVFGGLSGSQPFFLHWPSAAGESQSNAK